MRKRLVELIKESLNKHIDKSCLLAENIADDLIANGVVVMPCKVGVWSVFLSREDAERALKGVTDKYVGSNVKGGVLDAD